MHTVATLALFGALCTLYSCIRDVRAQPMRRTLRPQTYAMLYITLTLFVVLIVVFTTTLIGR
jgi:hypothetical protein